MCNMDNSSPPLTLILKDYRITTGGLWYLFKVFMSIRAGQSPTKLQEIFFLGNDYKKGWTTIEKFKSSKKNKKNRHKVIQKKDQKEKDNGYPSAKTSRIITFNIFPLHSTSLFLFNPQSTPTKSASKIIADKIKPSHRIP